MKDKTAVMCHNIAKYNREHCEPEMTAIKCADTLETVYGYRANEGTPIVQAALYAASILRRVASGEYVPVVWCRECIRKDTIACPALRKVLPSEEFITPPYMQYCSCGAREADHDNH